MPKNETRKQSLLDLLYGFYASGSRTQFPGYCFILLLSIGFALISDLVFGIPTRIVTYECIAFTMFLVFGLPLAYNGLRLLKASGTNENQVHRETIKEVHMAQAPNGEVRLWNTNQKLRSNLMNADLEMQQQSGSTLRQLFTGADPNHTAPKRAIGHALGGR